VDHVSKCLHQEVGLVMLKRKFSFSASTCWKFENSSSVDTRRDKSNQAANNVTDSHPEESAVVHNACIAEERGTDSNLQMHPLLFQASESGRLSYLPLSCNIGASSTFSFFSGHQPQLNL